jgi:hypothetical protein
MIKSIVRRVRNYLSSKKTRLKHPGFIDGDWIDDFGIYHPPRNWHKITKHCGGRNNNNNRL